MVSLSKLAGLGLYVYLAGIALCLGLLVCPGTSVMAQTHQPPAIAKTTWPAASLEVADLPSAVQADLGLEGAQVTGVKPAESYQIEHLNATRSRIQLVGPGGGQEAFNLRHAPVETGDTIIPFGPTHVDEAWINVVGPDRSRSLEMVRVVFPPSALNLTENDGAGNPLVKKAEAFSEALGFATDDEIEERVEWSIQKPPTRDGGFDTYRDQAFPMFPETSGCIIRNESKCTEPVSIALECHCASVVGTVRPSLSDQLTDNGASQVDVVAPGSGMSLLFNEDEEIVAASLKASLHLSRGTIFSPEEVRDQLVTYLDQRADYDPRNASDYGKVRFEVGFASDRVEVENARYQWAVGVYELEEETQTPTGREAVASVTMDAVTGNVTDARFKTGPITEANGDSGLDVAGLGVAVIAIAGLTAILVHRRRRAS